MAHVSVTVPTRQSSDVAVTTMFGVPTVTLWSLVPVALVATTVMVILTSNNTTDSHVQTYSATSMRTSQRHVVMSQPKGVATAAPTLTLNDVPNSGVGSAVDFRTSSQPTQGTSLTIRAALVLSTLTGFLMGLGLWRALPGRSTGKPMAMAAASAHRDGYILRDEEQPLTPSILLPTQRFPTALAGAVFANDETFSSEVLQSPLPVLLAFSAPWCGPCKLMEPVMQDVATEFRGRLKVVKVNIDLSPGVTTEYGVRSIPTIMLFQGGMKKETIVGTVPKKFIVDTIAPHVGRPGGV